MKIPTKYGRYLRYSLNIFSVLLALFVGYIFLYQKRSIIGIYAFLILIGFIGFIVDRKISYYLYMIHVFLLPTFSLYIISLPNNAFVRYGVFGLGAFLPYLIMFIHVKTRNIYYFERSITKISPMFMVALYLLLAIYIPNPKAFDIMQLDGLFIIYLMALIISSMSFLNIKYRTKLLCEKLNCDNIDDFLSEIIDKSNRIIIYDKSDVELILYYYERSINSFIHGDFDDAFMNCFKIIFDQTGFTNIYKIKNYHQLRPDFNKIRNALAHPKIRKVSKNMKQLKELQKELFLPTLDLIGKAKFEFLDQISKI